MIFERTEQLIKSAIEKRCAPSAVCIMGDKDGILYKKAFGKRRLYKDGAPCFDPVPETVPEGDDIQEDCMFDMASCTKVLAPTMLVFKAVENGEMTLRDSLFRFVNAPKDKEDIEIANLMTHTGGFKAHFMLENTGYSPEQAAEAILSTELSSKPGTRVEYSCMGYVLLGKILEKVYGMPLDKAANKYVFTPLGMTNTMYNPLSGGYKGKIAPTEYSEKLKKYKEGIVHDENAMYLGGVSANAGVFSTAEDIAKFATMLARKGEGYMERPTFDIATVNHTAHLENDDRGLGFVVKGRRLCSAGDLFSENSFGHTGYTGTFFFIDKETSFYIVFLTNRVHFTRENNLLLRHRRCICNSAMTEYSKYLREK